MKRKNKIIKSRSHIIKLDSEIWNKAECFLNDNYDDYSVRIVLKGTGEFEYNDMKEAYASIEEHTDNIDFIKISADGEQENFTLHFVNGPNYGHALLYADLLHTNKTEDSARQFVKELIKDTHAVNAPERILMSFFALLLALFTGFIKETPKRTSDIVIYSILIFFLIPQVICADSDKSFILGKKRIQFFTDQTREEKYNRYNKTFKAVDISLIVIVLLLGAALIVKLFFI